METTIPGRFRMGVTTHLRFLFCHACQAPVALIRVPANPDRYRGVPAAELTVDPECALARMAGRTGVPLFLEITEQPQAPPRFVRVIPGPPVSTVGMATGFANGPGSAFPLVEHRCGQH
jgi:hypothetical protein